jgi:glycosyltransferase involved in cell wall biosynthesis
MKTILHVIDTTGPGGAETVFVDLAARLDPARYRSLALIRGPGWVQQALAARGVETLVMDCKGSFNLRYLRDLVMLVRRRNIDVIQSHLLGSNVYCAMAGMLARCPVIATFHGAVDIGGSERLPGVKFALVRVGSSRIIAVSRALAGEIAARIAVPLERLDVVYNGIDTGRFGLRRSNRLREQLRLPVGSLLLGALGNIRFAKDYPVLLDAFAVVAARLPGVHLVVAGEGGGPLLAGLHAQRAALGLTARVHFTGFVADPVEYLGNLDMFVLSSRSEGFSIATIQAMAAGLPVVATRSGGPQEIISNGENGLLVAPGQPAELAQALESLLIAPERCAALAAAGQESVRARFDIADMIERYQSFYG